MNERLVEEVGLVEPCIPWRRYRGRSYSWGSGGGGGATPSHGFLVPSFGAGGVLASMGRTSRKKCAIWAGRVFLSVSGRGVSESVAVGALGVVIGLDDSLDFPALGEEEDA